MQHTLTFANCFQGELGRISSARKAKAASPDINGYSAGAAGAKQIGGDTSESPPSKGGGFFSSFLGSSGGGKSQGGKDRGAVDGGGIIVGVVQRSPQVTPRSGKVVIGADPEEEKANLKVNKWLFSNQVGPGCPKRVVAPRSFVVFHPRTTPVSTLHFSKRFSRSGLIASVGESHAASLIFA